MSEQQSLSSGINQETGQASDNAGAYEITPGTYLREVREAAGLHLATLAASLKVSVSKLEALEHDQYDLLPDAVFTRALASSVCRMLKLDPAPVLDRLPPIGAARFVSQDRGINEPFRPRNIGPAPSVWAQVSRPAVLAGVVLLLGALVLIFLPSIRKEAVLEGADSSRAVVSGPARQSSVALSPKAGLEDTAAMAALPAASAERVATGTREIVIPTQDAAALSAAAPVTGAAASSGVSPLAAFRATGESWVKVTDGKGVVVLNRTLGAGEAADVSGVLPLSAVVGRADVTQVQVRGQAFDLNAVSKNNVARFEVK
ncbi:MAG: helix-turn-helix domain-containing protein [Polaromonas sp.]